MRRTAAALAGLALIAPMLATGVGAAKPAKPAWTLTSVFAERGAIVCPRECTPANVRFPPNDSGIRHVCFGTSLVDVKRVYSCDVQVGGVVSGRAAKDVPVHITFSVTSDDGSPWGDDVRRTIRSRPELTKPLAPGAPPVCSVWPEADARVSCKKVGPRTWRSVAATSTKTGFYTFAFGIEFPASTSTELVCEYLRISGSVTTSGVKTTIKIPRRAYCA